MCELFHSVREAARYSRSRLSCEVDFSLDFAFVEPLNLACFWYLECLPDTLVEVFTCHSISDDGMILM